MKPESIEILAAENILANAKVALAETIRKTQMSCIHEKVGETAEPVNGDSEILRVCLVCGLGATNRFGNYGVLGDSRRLVYKLTNSQAVTLRRT